MPSTPPSRAALAAQTDQDLAHFAEERSGLSGPEGELTARMAARTAALLAAEFPRVPELGRIVISVAHALDSLGRALGDKGIEADVNGLLTVAALAGEQLDREARDDA